MGTHKALRLKSYEEPIVLEHVPTDPVVPGSAIVRINHTRLMAYSRDWFSGKTDSNMVLPLTPGAGGVGRIEAVGPDATTLQPGQLVWIDASIYARDDSSMVMLMGRHAGFDPNRKLMTNIWRDGTYAEKVRVPLEVCLPLNEERLLNDHQNGGLGYKLQDLASLNTLFVGGAGLDSAHVQPGQTVIVAPATGKFSAGGVLMALAMGANVIAASRNGEAMKALWRFPGAKERLQTVKLQSDAEKDTKALMEATLGRGAHVFLDLSPPEAAAHGTPTHIVAGIAALKRHGVVVLMGGIRGTIQVPYAGVMLRNLTIMGQLVWTRAQSERFIAMIENGNVALGERVGWNVLGEFPLENIEEAMDLASQGLGWGNDVLLSP